MHYGRIIARAHAQLYRTQKQNHFIFSIVRFNQTIQKNKKNKRAYNTKHCREINLKAEKRKKCIGNCGSWHFQYHTVISLQIGRCQADFSAISPSAIPPTVAVVQPMFRCNCWHWHNCCNSLNDSKQNYACFENEQQQTHWVSLSLTHALTARKTKYVLMRFTVNKTTDNFR